MTASLGHAFSGVVGGTVRAALRFVPPTGAAAAPGRAGPMPVVLRDAADSSARLAKGRIVHIVEDDAEIRSALAEILVEEGYEVRMSSDGREALERLRGSEATDLVLLDLMMPTMDGWEFRVAQRRDPRLSSIPVIAISADASPKAAAIDADAYLSKPVGCDALLGTVERVLRDHERRKLHAAVAERERLAALGTLAAGMAHEINNPLAFVKANLDFVVARRAAAARLVEDGIDAALEAACGGCDRVSAIVRDMQLLSRPADQATAPVDVRRVLDSAVNIAMGQLRGRARLVKDYQDVPSVEVNASRLGQVFLNLLVNAAQAVPEGQPSHHEVRVSVRHDTGGGAVVIEVADTGPGIPAEIRASIFQPFFTTKPVGSGTGLGLSIVHGLVTEMRGHIVVESEHGRGATFRVSLPVGSPATVTAPPAPGALPRAPRTRRPSVLVIDDESAICEVVVRLLRATHEVESCTVAGEAIRRIEAGARFDVILCDMAMPGKRGSDVHAVVHAIAPDQAARMVFLTGGALDETARQFLALRAPFVVAKPFSSGDLHARVDAMVDALGLL